MKTKKEQESFNGVIEALWKKSNDVFYVQSYAYDWVENLLAKQKNEIIEMINKKRITDVEKLGQFEFLHSKGYNQALNSILEELNK